MLGPEEGMRSGGEQFLEAQPHLIHRLSQERFIPATQIEDAKITEAILHIL